MYEWEVLKQLILSPMNLVEGRSLSWGPVSGPGTVFSLLLQVNDLDIKYSVAGVTADGTLTDSGRWDCARESSSEATPDAQEVCASESHLFPLQAEKSLPPFSSRSPPPFPAELALERANRPPRNRTSSGGTNPLQEICVLRYSLFLSLYLSLSFEYCVCSWFLHSVYSLPRLFPQCYAVLYGGLFFPQPQLGCTGGGQWRGRTFGQVALFPGLYVPPFRLRPAGQQWRWEGLLWHLPWPQLQPQTLLLLIQPLPHNGNESFGGVWVCVHIQWEQ